MSSYAQHVFYQKPGLVPLCIHVYTKLQHTFSGTFFRTHVSLALERFKVHFQANFLNMFQHLHGFLRCGINCMMVYDMTEANYSLIKIPPCHCVISGILQIHFELLDINIICSENYQTIIRVIGCFSSSQNN